MMQFIDTHTHINDEAFRGDEEAIISRALAAGVTRMIQADIDISERQSMFDLVDKHPGTLYSMLGLYPGSVKEDWQREIDAVMALKDKRRYVAIGEIGLDYHFSTEFAAEQREALRVQFELAAKMGLPVNIHLRDATDDFFAILDDCSHLGLHGNLHAFSGSYETFCRLQKYGEWLVGIGGVVTFKNASVAKAVEKIPLDHIILETDAPYLTPVPHRGERNESAYIPIVAQKVADIKGVTVEEVAAVTTANAEHLFGLEKPQ